MWRVIMNTIHFLSILIASHSCTVFLAGKDATSDGSVLISHSNDGEFTTDPRLVKVPAADHPPGSQRPIFFSPEEYPRYVGTERGIPEYFPKDSSQKPFEPIGYIPEVPHTYAYLEQTYGALNEKQVGIGESTCSAVFGALPLSHPNGTALFSVDELSRIAMERASTAREAISIMGDLATAHGFYGAGSFEGEGEALAVSDPEEAWVFHILPDDTGRSAIWAAQRVPDDHFSVVANMYVIRGVDPENEDNFMMSESVHSVAEEEGWWTSGDGLLDFTAVYSDGEYAHKFYSGRRMWGAYHLASPSLTLSPHYTNLLTDLVYPVSAQPDELLSVQDFFKMHRYYYQGTQFDLGAEGNLAGGPFGSPDRFKEGENELDVGGSWERAIGLYRTSDSHVVQTRSWTNTADGGLGGILWFGPSSALGTVYTPFFVGTSNVPQSFRGHQLNFDRGSMFWAVVYAHNIANMKWSYAIKDLEKRQHHLESNSVRVVAMADEAFSKSGDLAEAENSFNENVAQIVSSLWSLSDELMFKYADGFVNYGKGNMSNMVGYPKWWLEVVGFKDGPPPPPTPNRARLELNKVGLSGKAAVKFYKSEERRQL